ncbi:MAG: GNAT family N-acetyltransferase [Zhenhengia sp.]|jgi:ribosomal protein S18 acetylase RimI-like enzyme|uniref:GNAT family N-acetyltransferase n=1 Tax=Zhenhengia sp. TaxID=2944208 RepID=UPI002908D1EC|nr:GNAT family N-acetyltransferase [Clostridiales bacterium]MDU6975144.1 GNAT family N-acetyltransferase [Clostridiales bacterium]
MVKLSDINENNYEACSGLMCTQEQCEFTNSPIWSLLQAAYASFKDKSKLYCISDDNRVVGMIRLDFSVYDDYYMFTNLIIDKSYQRKGIATQAVRLALDIFREEKKFEVVRIHVATKNTHAIHLYKKVGFVSTNKFSENGLLIMEYSL